MWVLSIFRLNNLPKYMLDNERFVLINLKKVLLIEIIGIGRKIP
jgi:hypothetical protein